MNDGEAVVLNEEALGYVSYSGEILYIGILASKIGGPNWRNGPVRVIDQDVVRKATREDFDEYRVSPEGYL